MTNTFTTLRGRIFSAAFLICMVALSTGVATAQKVWKNVGQPGFSAGHVADNAMAVDTGGAPHVVFVDSAHGNKATVMKYNGSSWVLVGSAGISAGAVNSCAIAFDRLNNIYVTYVDLYNGSRITVKKYVSGTWITVGSEGFSTGSIGYPTIAVDMFNVPYVAYSDDYWGYSCSAMKFNETTGAWAPMGGVGFSGGQVGYVKMAVDTGKAKFVVFEDFNNGYGATVMAYDDSTDFWYVVDSANISHGWVTWTNIACDRNGRVFVSYQDCSDSNRISVKTYFGHHWHNAGNADFSATIMQYPDIAVDQNGMPYVVYNDWAYNSEATAMSLNPVDTTWTTCGNEQGFSAGAALYTTIAIDHWGTPYVSFMDTMKKATVMKLGTAPIAGADSICISQTVHMTDITSGGTWTSSDTAVATIDPNTGYLFSKAAGTTTISYNIPHDVVTLVVTVNTCVESVNNVNSNKGTLTIFPDPNHGAFTLHISAAQREAVAVIITNMMGQKVKEVSATTNTDTPIQLDIPGLYFVSAITSQGRVSGKVVVE